MTDFEIKLRENLIKEGLDEDLGMKIYVDIFRVVRDNMRSETHKHDLMTEQLDIYVPMLGNFKTKMRNNEKERKHEQLI